MRLLLTSYICKIFGHNDWFPQSSQPCFLSDSEALNFGFRVLGFYVFRGSRALYFQSCKISGLQVIDTSCSLIIPPFERVTRKKINPRNLMSNVHTCVMCVNSNVCRNLSSKGLTRGIPRVLGKLHKLKTLWVLNPVHSVIACVEYIVFRTPFTRVRICVSRVWIFMVPFVHILCLNVL